MSLSENHTHWSNMRSAPVDKSKRVAYGCTISDSNILSGTRRRVNHDYGKLNREPAKFEDILVRPNHYAFVKDNRTTSKNSYEARSGLKNITNTLDEMSISPVKPRKKKLTKNTEEASSKTTTKEARVDSFVLPPAEEVPTAKPSSKVVSPKQPDYKNNKPARLNSEIFSHLKRLGARRNLEDLDSNNLDIYTHSLGHRLTYHDWLGEFLEYKLAKDGYILSYNSAEANWDFDFFAPFSIEKNEVDEDSVVSRKDFIFIADAGTTTIGICQDSAITPDGDAVIQVLGEENITTTMLLSTLLKNLEWCEVEEDMTSASIEW
ncbi:developmentally-regulated protein [Acrasis kona]|uniref:Developmentally-regulated protein n=1 Tax=Acrasis kona TaxID=1008807 RepID=A0AAW2YPG3_9EUKA